MASRGLRRTRLTLNVSLKTSRPTTPVQTQTLVSAGGHQGDGDEPDYAGSNDTFLSALTSQSDANGDPRLSWVSSGDSLNDKGDTVDPEAFPITDIAEEPESDGEAPPSGSRGQGADSPRSSSSSSAGGGIHNRSFSASDEDINKNANARGGARDSCGSSDSVSAASPPGEPVSTSTPMTHLEPKVIVMDTPSNQNSNNSNNNPDVHSSLVQDIFHSNQIMALDTTPVLSPSNVQGGSVRSNNDDRLN